MSEITKKFAKKCIDVSSLWLSKKKVPRYVYPLLASTTSLLIAQNFTALSLKLEIYKVLSVKKIYLICTYS